MDKNTQSHCTDSQNAEIQDRQTFSGQLPSVQCMTTESTDLLDVPPKKLSVFQEQPDETPPDEPAIPDPVVHSAEHQMDTFDIDTNSNADESKYPNLAEMPGIFPTKPLRTFLELFSGKKLRFSSHILQLGTKTFQPFDIFLDSAMNILDDDCYLMLLRIIPSKQVGTLLAAPPCTEYSLLKLKQPGPFPCRSPDCMDVPFSTQRIAIFDSSPAEKYCPEL